MTTTTPRTEFWGVSDDAGRLVATCPTEADAARVMAALDEAAGGAIPDGHRDAFWHNVVAHPLLVLCPRLGRWIHRRTKPTVERGGLRRLLGQRVV